MKNVYCLFEQSGTFKNEFKKLGFNSFDYDLKNDFGETDVVVDLFVEIEKAYNGEHSFFDCVSSDDLLFAFFPCIRFENQIMLSFRGQAFQYQNYSIREKMVIDMELMESLNHYYQILNKLCIVCIDRHFKLIIENPFSKEHFLYRYWCLPASIVDMDRRASGDYFKKPTQFWFININPQCNFVPEAIEYNAIVANDFCGDGYRDRKSIDFKITGANSIRVGRSMISSAYANRFIKQYILESD